MKKLALIFTCLLMALGSGQAFASSPPSSLPHAFYGSLTINGAAAPAGTVVELRGEGILAGVNGNPLATTEAGSYGSADRYGTKLLGQGQVEDGTVLTFYVNGVAADTDISPVLWHSGEATVVNLSAEISGGSGTGGGTGGSGGGSDTNVGTIRLSGIISSRGKLWEKVKLLSDDEKCKLTIPKGTICLKADGEAPYKLTIKSITDTPSPPQNAYIIGLAYDFGPDGVTFDPPATLEYEYDPDDIPGGYDEEYLVIAYYDDSSEEWAELATTIDIDDNTLTTLVEHFTTFAVLALKALEAPAAAAIEVTGLTITPQEVIAGEPVNISVAVSNTGGTAGSYTIYVDINGIRKLCQSVSLKPGESRQADFTVVKTEAGTYSVSTGGFIGSFTVIPVALSVPEAPSVTATPGTVAEVSPEPETPPSPTSQSPLPPPADDSSTNWLLIGLIAGGVLVIGLLIIILVRRRAC
jgi:hypothetical protein